VEESHPATVSFAPTPAHARPQTPPHPVEVHSEVEKPLDQRIPRNLPPEVQVIIDAYISGTPLIVAASRSMLGARWDASVPEECAYVYLGFFSVGQVLVRFSFFRIEK